MCGICGIWNTDGRPVDPALLVRMRDSLAHRGPDGAGAVVFDEAGLGLGHRRLSIIDLATGDQPMANQDESIWVVFNGEIYNYRELRDELRAAGYVFRTASDTEVILHAYAAYGP